MRVIENAKYVTSHAITDTKLDCRQIRNNKVRYLNHELDDYKLTSEDTR